MANGIRLSALRRSIRALQQPCTKEQLTSAFAETPASALGPWLLDRHYVALPKPVWDDVLQHCGIGEFSYKSELRDCDDFAMTVRGRVPLELKVNGVGVVLDWSAGHAYNALLYTEGGGFHVGFIEPEADYPSTWWVKQPGREGMYDMDNGVAIF